MAKAGSRQTGKFEIDGEEFEVQFGTVEMVLWERANKGQAFMDPDGSQHFQRTAWCIWSAAKRGSKTELSFDAWMTKVADIWVEQDDPDEGHDDPKDGDTPAS